MFCAIRMRKINEGYRIMKMMQSGRSMIEMLGVLAIVGILAVAGIAGFSKMMMQHRISTTVEQIGMISSKLSAIGSKSSSYNGLSNAAALKLGAIPSDATPASGSTLTNVFGGDITIAPTSMAGGTSTDKMAYTITYSNLPEEACIAIASNEWSNSRNSTLMGIAAGKGSISAATIVPGCAGSKADGLAVACPDGSTLSLPMDVGTATNACSCTSSGCTVILKYR